LAVLAPLLEFGLEAHQSRFESHTFSVGDTHEDSSLPSQIRRPERSGTKSGSWANSAVAETATFSLHRPFFTMNSDPPDSLRSRASRPMLARALCASPYADRHAGDSEKLPVAMTARTEPSMTSRAAKQLRSRTCRASSSGSRLAVTAWRITTGMTPPEVARWM